MHFASALTVADASVATNTTNSVFVHDPLHLTAPARRAAVEEIGEEGRSCVLIFALSSLSSAKRKTPR